LGPKDAACRTREPAYRIDGQKQIDREKREGMKRKRRGTTGRERERERERERDAQR
jgi:hypothetical protein